MDNPDNACLKVECEDSGDPTVCPATTFPLKRTCEDFDRINCKKVNT